MVTHDPGAASYANQVVFLADGRTVDKVFAPTVDTVLDRVHVWTCRPSTTTAEEGAVMWRATITGVAARRLRLALTSPPPCWGVTFVVGTLVLTDTANKLGVEGGPEPLFHRLDL